MKKIFLSLAILFATVFWSGKMKLYKRLILFCLATVFILQININVTAMNTGLSTRDMIKEDQTNFLANSRFTLIDTEPKLNSINCFDVREDGMIAIGSSNHSEKYVIVIDRNRNFVYGYSFDDSGDFRIQWEGPNIIIYYVRGGIAASYDEKGKCVELKRFEVTSDNNDYWNHTIEKTTRIIGNDTYKLKSDIPISFSYSKITKIDPSGTETTIYDVGAIHTVRVIAIIIAVLLFIAIVIIGLIRTVKKSFKVIK